MEAIRFLQQLLGIPLQVHRFTYNHTKQQIDLTIADSLPKVVRLTVVTVSLP